MKSIEPSALSEIGVKKSAKNNVDEKLIKICCQYSLEQFVIDCI